MLLPQTSFPEKCPAYEACPLPIRAASLFLGRCLASASRGQFRSYLGSSRDGTPTMGTPAWRPNTRAGPGGGGGGHWPATCVWHGVAPTSDAWGPLREYGTPQKRSHFNALVGETAPVALWQSEWGGGKERGRGGLCADGRPNGQASHTGAPLIQEQAKASRATPASRAAPQFGQHS